MKKIFSFVLMLLSGFVVLTSCSDDNESNPTLVQPSQFSMFQPAVGDAVVDLSKSSAITLSWSIPNYTDFGAPVVPTYIVQMSPVGSFTKKFDADSQDNEGADFVTLEQTFNSPTADINCELINQALQQMLGWTDYADVPATLDITLRAIASIRDASSRDYNEIVSSNTVTVKTAPYYILKRDPFCWYMVGNNIGSASWSNDAAGVGLGLIPLLPSTDETYDEATGTGVISYTGYLPAGTQFKFILNPGSWDDQLNYTNVKNPDANLISDEDGDNHNIGIKADGYYTIKIDTKAKTIIVEAYEKNVKTFASMAMPGTHNGWDASGTPMTACETLSGESHVWVAQFDVDADAPADGGVKFAANGAWDDNWGSAAFPWGNGTGGGANIPYTAGSYTVIFNDITGQYFFIAN